MRRLAILGASGYGKVVADTAECMGWQQVVFFDDVWPDLKMNGCWPVSGNTTDLLADLPSFDGVVVAIGDNRARQQKTRELLDARAPLVTIRHPAAVISRYAQIGIGSVITAGAVIGADAHLGMASIINVGATVSHDCILGEAVHVSPGAHLAGGAEVGDLTWIGIGSSVRQLVRIGKRVVVGAGSVVVKDVDDDLVVIGVPAAAIGRD